MPPLFQHKIYMSDMCNEFANKLIKWIDKIYVLFSYDEHFWAYYKVNDNPKYTKFYDKINYINLLNVYCGIRITR